MSAEIYLVADGLPGSLFIMPCPSGERLSADIETYRGKGVGTIVSMLAVDEADMLGLANEKRACSDVGIEFISCAINDFGLPDAVVFDVLIGQIAGLLLAGRMVAVHCRAGIGRSGMVTAATLIALGFDSDAAIKQVSRSRGIAIPDTVEQGKFIANFAQRYRFI